MELLQSAGAVSRLRRECGKSRMPAKCKNVHLTEKKGYLFMLQKIGFDIADSAS